MFMELREDKAEIAFYDVFGSVRHGWTMFKRPSYHSTMWSMQRREADVGKSYPIHLLVLQMRSVVRWVVIGGIWDVWISNQGLPCLFWNNWSWDLSIGTWSPKLFQFIVPPRTWVEMHWLYLPTTPRTSLEVRNIWSSPIIWVKDVDILASLSRFFFCGNRFNFLEDRRPLQDSKRQPSNKNGRGACWDLSSSLGLLSS